MAGCVLPSVFLPSLENVDRLHQGLLEGLDGHQNIWCAASIPSIAKPWQLTIPKCSRMPFKVENVSVLTWMHPLVLIKGWNFKKTGQATAKIRYSDIPTPGSLRASSIYRVFPVTSLAPGVMSLSSRDHRPNYCGIFSPRLWYWFEGSETERLPNIESILKLFKISK